MSDPSFWENGDHAKEISQKATEAKAAYDTYTRLFARAESIKELLDMAIEENDQDMEGELEEEINELKDILDKKEIELLLNDEYDANNAIITFHAGAGGTEAQDWTEMLIRMYIKWAESEGFVLEELNMLPGDEAGVKSAEYMVRGKFAYGLLKSEKGVHRLVRISPFDAAKRRHTSFSAVDVMPEIGDDIEIDFNTLSVKFEISEDEVVRVKSRNLRRTKLYCEKTQNKLKIYNKGLVGHLDDKGIIIDGDFIKDSSLTIYVPEDVSICGEINASSIKMKDLELRDFNLEVFLELEWDTTLYNKNSHSLNLGFVKIKPNDKGKIIFMSNQKFEDNEIIQKFELTELEEPVIEYISK